MSEVTTEVARQLDEEEGLPAWIEAVLHPERFFRSAEIRLNGVGRFAIVVACAVATASGVIARSDQAISPGTEVPFRIAQGVGYALGALMIGMLVWSFCAFSYWLRLTWSGADEPRGRDCWAISGICSLVTVLPSVAALLAGAARMEGPLQVMKAGSPWLATVAWFFVELWATWMGYQAGIVRYDLRVVPARVCCWSCRRCSRSGGPFWCLATGAERRCAK